MYNFRSRDEYYAQYSVSRILLYPTIERKSNGRNERMNESRENLQLSHIYTENIIKISI
jgi:hypothetical protein